MGATLLGRASLGEKVLKPRHELDGLAKMKGGAFLRSLATRVRGFSRCLGA